MAGVEAFLKARDFLFTHRTDYDAAFAGFRWPEMQTFNWALDYFDTIGERRDQLALWIVDEGGDEEKFTFQELTRLSNQTANFLRGLGVRRGDRVLVMLNNVPALWQTMLACIKLGAVLVPTSTLMTSDELQDRLTRGNIRAVVTETSFTQRFQDTQGEFLKVVVGDPVAGWEDFHDIQQADVQFSPDGLTFRDDLLLLYFTSGTTSKPKLVAHTHQSYPVGHLSTLYWIGLRPGDLHLNISSPGWAKHAWSNFFAPWNAEATVFVYTYQRFNAQKALSVIAEKKVSSVCAPPTVWRMFIQQPLANYQVSLRELVSAGEPLNPEVIQQVQSAWGLTIRDGFGQTETTAKVGNSPGQKVKEGSMGRPMPGFPLALIDPEGNEASEGELSIRLAEKPTGLMRGYEDDPERTIKAMGGAYYHTGDVVSRDEEGYLTYVGRADDIFKASDYRISPFELESCLIEHPAVVEAAVVPSPDPVRLAVPKAYVILAEGYEPNAETARSIFAHSRKSLASFKHIRRLQFYELPKTTSGKIRRVELRGLEEEAHKKGERQPGEFWEEDLKS
ncbi:MAG: AMP-binding protein [Myxococcales bacterium]|nr:AMP-binding protein [Myxococcales bacterium]